MTATKVDKRVTATLTEELKIKVKQFVEDGHAKSESELAAKAIEFYLNNFNNTAPTSSPLSDETQEWFTTSEKKKREQLIEDLGIEGDKIEMTEAELLQKASELSGSPIEEIERQGRQLLAQKLISTHAKSDKTNKSGTVHGVAGGADQRLDEAYEDVKRMIASGSYKPKDGRIPLTKITTRASTNYNTAKSWAMRRGHTELLG